MATAALVIGALTAAGGAVYSGVEANKQGKAQQSIAKYNARMAEIEAKREKEAKLMKMRDIKAQGDKLRGAQEALYGAAGVFGTTPMAFALETQKDVAKDIAVVAADAEYGDILAKSQMFNIRAEGSAAARRGQSALISGGLQAGGTLLSSYGQYKSKT